MYELDMFELYDIASGRDSTNTPYSIGSLNRMIEKNGKYEMIDFCDTNEAEININASGGCVVITIDFPKNMLNAWKNANRIASEWLKNVNNPNMDNQSCTLLVVPYLLSGRIQIIFNEMCFSDSYESKNFYRLILGFDNYATNVTEDDDADIEDLVLGLKAELKRREDELDAEILEAEEKEKELNSKIYLHGIGDLNDIDNLLKQDDKEVDKFNGNKNVRVSGEEDE